MNRNQNTTGGLPLDLQLFAEETEQEHTEAETGAENTETETEATEGGTGSETLTFDELLSSNKIYQSAFDTKITSALNKAKKNGNSSRLMKQTKLRNLQK